MDQLSCNLTWKSFNQYYAQHAKHGIIAELDCGVTVYWTQSNLLFMNAFFLSSAVSDEADLRRRLEGIKAYVTEARPSFPWVIMIEPELLPANLRERTQEICLTANFNHVGNFKCMHASSFLPPERSVSNIEIKFATSEQDIHDALLLNVHAHHMDTSIAKNVVENRTALANFEKEICCIVYIDEKPVATASTLLLDNCLYVILVATSEQHRKVCSMSTLCLLCL